MRHIEDLIKDYKLSEENDEYFLFSFRYWGRTYHQDVTSDKVWNCLKGKIDEYLFVKDSKKFNLPFEVELNYGDPFGPDLYLKKSKFEIAPCDYKGQFGLYHPCQKNDFNITGENFTTLRRSQIDDYCKNGLSYILIDRNIDMSRDCNKRVLSFAERFNWTGRDLILDSKRTVIIVEVERLCKMIDKNEDVIFLVIPEDKRYDRNGSFSGDTIGFNYEIFSNINITGTN